MFSYSCAYSFDATFAFSSQFLGRILKEKGHFGWTFCTFKILLNRRFKFPIYFKNDNNNFRAVPFFFSHIDTKIQKFRIQLMDIFFHCLSPFSGFSFQSNRGCKDHFLSLRRFDNFLQAFTCSKLTIETLEQGVKYV